MFRRPISANPRFNFNPGFFFFRSKVFSRISSSSSLEHPVIELLTKGMEMNLLYNLNFTQNLDYLYSTLNNPTRSFIADDQTKLFQSQLATIVSLEEGQLASLRLFSKLSHCCFKLHCGKVLGTPWFL